MSIIKLITYTTSRKKEPFIVWLEDLDSKVQSIILARLDRISLGNFGDCKQIKGSNGIWELRIQYGSGYRVYFGKSRMVVIVLLIGGDKGSQDRDIAKAKRYWLDYKESLNE